ncbi:Ig-like domain-containing protein [Pontibacter sp. CAU 1760]
MATQPNSNTLVVNQAGSYSVQVTNDGCSATSAATTVSATPLPTAAITSPASGTQICAGQSVTLNAQTGTGYTYAWTRNGTTIPNETSATLSVVQGGDYRVLVTANGCSATSELVNIIVNHTPNATITAEGPLQFCLGGYVRLRAPNAPGGEVYSYEWFRGDVLVSTDPTAPFYDALLSGSYTVKITTDNGCTNTSAERVVSVGSPTEAAISYAGDTEFCQGGLVSLRANEAPQSQTYTYEWFKNNVSLGFTGRIYEAKESGSYHVVVTSSGCTKPSDEVVVTVYPKPSATVSSPQPAQCIGSGNTTTFTVNATYTGTSAVWASSNPNFVIQNPVYDNGVASATVIATGTGDAVISLTASRTETACTSGVGTVGLTVRSLPVTTVSASGSTTFCQGQSVTLSVPSAPGASYEWFMEGNPNPVGFANSYSASVQGVYSVKVTDNGCVATSSPTTVTVNALPTASITPSGPAAICEGGSVTLTANTDTGTSFIWFRNGSEQVGTGPTFSATAAGSYTVQATNANGCNQTSAPTVVNVNTAPSATVTIIGSTNLCQGQTATLQAPAAPSGKTYTYQWFNGSTLIPAENGGTNTSYTAGAAGSYAVRVTDVSTTLNCNTTTTPPVVIQVIPVPGMPGVAQNGQNERCGTGTVTLTSTLGTDGTVNRWYDTNTSTAILSQSLTFTTPSLSASRDYFVSTYNATTGCESTRVMVPAVIKITPTLAITSPVASTFCASDAAQDLTATPTGGTFRILQGTTVRDGNATSFNPAALGAGSYTVEYSYTAPNGCSNTTTKNVTVNPGLTAPTTNLVAGRTYYTGARYNGQYYLVLTGTAAPAGGTAVFSGPGVTKVGNEFRFTACNALQTGQTEAPVNIVYTITNSSGCTSSTTTAINVKRSTFTLVLQATPFPVCKSVNTSYVARVLRDAVVNLPSTADVRTQPINVVSFEEDVSALFNIEAGIGSGVNNPSNYNKGATFSNSSLSSEEFYLARATPTGTFSSCASVSQLLSNKIYLGTPEISITRSVPGSICPGTSVTFTASTTSSNPGTILYQWTVNGTAVPNATTSTFTSSTLQNGDVVAVEYNVVNGGCANRIANNTFTMVVVTPQTVTGGSYCAGTSGFPISMGGSQVGVNYQLVRIDNGSPVNVGTALAGNGSALTFSNQPAGTYSVVPVSANGACGKFNDVVVTETPLPTLFTVSGGGRYCAGGAGVPVLVSGSQPGITYRLMNGTTEIAAVTRTTAEAFSFSNVMAPGTYTVIASTTANQPATAACTQQMTGSATIVVDSLPGLASAQNVERCASGDVILSATGAPANGSYNWYSAPSGGQLLATGPSTYTAQNISTTTSYYVVAVSEFGCESATRTKVDAIVRERAVPIGDIYVNGQPITSNTRLEADKSATFTVAATNVTSADVTLYEWKLTTTSGGTKVIGGNSPSVTFNVPKDYTELTVLMTLSESSCFTANSLSLIAGPVQTFPVEIIYLNATKQGNQVVLEWATASEQDNAGFEVQVSEDGQTYRKLAFIPTKNGNASTKQLYTYTDKESGKFGTRYYRLKQIDASGSFEYFGPKVVQFGQVASRVIAYPNPFQSEVTLDIAAEEAGEVVLLMTDAVGKQLLKRTISVKKGFTTEKLKLDNTLPVGLYIIRAQVGNTTQYIKLLKE